MLLYVLGAASTDDAKAQAEDGGYLPDELNDFKRGKVAVAHQGAELWFIDADYARGIATDAGTDAGSPPTGGKEGAGGPGGASSDPIGRDVSFTTGGATKKIFKSLSTRQRKAKDGWDAPDFKGLIGVDVKGGKVEGCEVVSPTSDFSIVKRFPQITVSYFRTMMSLVACINDAPFLGLDIGEVLFCGCDGQYKDGDPTPWTLTGRFKFSPNITDTPNLTVGDITLDSPVYGHSWIWIIYEQEEISISLGGAAPDKYVVQTPKFVYEEQVYQMQDLTKLNLG